MTRHRFPLMLSVLLILLVGPAAAQSWQAKVAAPLLDALANSGEAPFVVVLSEQADVSAARSLTTKEAKGAFVYDALRTTALATQGPVVAALEALGAPVRRYYIVNAIGSEGNAAVVQALALRADVAYVVNVWTGHPTLPPQEEGTDAAGKTQAIEDNITHVNADDVWAMGITGQGAVVGGSDTGYAWEHETLINQYRGYDGAAADHDFNWHDAVHAGSNVLFCPNDSPEPCDDDEFLAGGHGTHTMGTMIGSDLHPSDPGWPFSASRAIGMAPGATWIGCRNLFNGLGTLQTYLECNEWHLAPYPFGGDPMTDGDPSKAAHVINNSWGCVEGCPTAPPPENPGDPDPDPLRVTVRNLRNAGIVYVQSVGNDGPDCSTAAFPAAIYGEAFAVGATDHRNDQIASFSSRGPVLVDGSMRRKPDISAPGVRVLSGQRDGTYASLSGTSMAGPHVAGLVALIISANPSLAGDVDAIEDIIEQTALGLTTTDGCGGDGPNDSPNNTFGWGRFDALAAVQAALGIAPEVNARVFLEGSYDGGQMQPALADDLPTDQPYNTAPWNYAGTESVAAGFFAAHPDIVDWVLVELRSDASTPVARRAALLRQDGAIVDLDGAGSVLFPDASASAGQGLFIAVFHRNHLAAMSPAAVLPSGDSYGHDFTTGAAFGFDPLKDFGDGAFGLYAGDADADGQVQTDDKNIQWRQQVGLPGYRSADFNLNGEVQTDDKNFYWRPNVGKGSSIDP